MMMLVRRGMALCSRMKYFREMATFLDMKVPLINRQISLQPHQTCIVHGLKRIQIQENEEAEGQQIESQQVQPQVNQEGQNVEEKEKEKEEAENNEHLQTKDKETHPEQPIFQYDQYCKETISFELALKVSQSLDMDLSLMRAGTSTKQTVLTLSQARKHIYSEYNRLYLQKRTDSDWKHIKIGQKIEKNDTRTKYKNIQRMLKLGERRFRLQSDSDSEKGKKMLVEFGKLFGKEVEPYIQTFRQGKHGRRKYKQRWAANLVFYEQVPLDYDKINKKWKRRMIQQQVAQKHAEKEEEHRKELFQSNNADWEGKLYQIGLKHNIKMPEHMEKMAKLQRQMKSGDKMALFRSVVDNQGKKDSYEIQWDSEEERMFQKRSQEYNKTFFEQRTVEDILDEMEELKNSGYESQPHKVARFNLLKKQLNSLMKRNTPGI